MERLWSTACRVIGTAGALLFSALAFTPLISIPHRVMATPTAAGQADAIVVLGASVSPDGLLDAPSLRRALAAILAQREGRAPRVLFLGPRNGRSVEAEVRARLARDLGIEASTILTEARGLTTREEALRAAALLLPRGERRIALVTSEHHLSRAMSLFRRAGFEVLPIAVRELPVTASRPQQRLATAIYLSGEAAARLLSRTLGQS
jgi:uncharacterized SAM-binding protein YcdF (DUF218 family)